MIFVFLNFGNSIDIIHRLLRFCEVTLAIMMEVSQILYLCLSSYFMFIFEIFFSKFTQCFPIFHIFLISHLFLGAIVYHYYHDIA